MNLRWLVYKIWEYGYKGMPDGRKATYSNKVLQVFVDGKWADIPTEIKELELKELSNE